MIIKNKNLVLSRAGVYESQCKNCELVRIGKTGGDLDTHVRT